MSRSRQQLRDVASCFAALNSYDSEATAIKTATASLLGGNQKDLRTLCSAKWVAGDGKQTGWGVKRRDEFGDDRKDADIRRDLEKSVLQAARAYLSKIGVAEPASVLSSASRQQNDGSQTAVHQPSHGGDPDMTSQQSIAGDGAPTQGSPLSSEGLQSHPSTVGAAEHASSPASIARNESSRHDLLTPDRQSSSSKQDAAPQYDSNSLNDINASGHGWGPASASLQQSGGRQTAALLPSSLGNQRTSISSISSSNQDACQQGGSDQDDALQRSSASGGAAEHASSSAKSKSKKQSPKAKSKVQSGATRTHRNDIEERAGAAEHAPRANPGTASAPRSMASPALGDSAARHGAATPAVHAAPQAKRPRTIRDALGACLGLGEAASERLAGNPAARAQRGAAEHSASSSAAAGCRQALVEEERPLLASADATGQARADAASIATPVPARKKPRTEGTVVPASAASSASCDASVASADAPLSTMRDAERTDGDLPYPKLFPKQSDVVTETLRWIQANRKEEKAANFYVEFERWERGLEDGTLHNRNRRKQLCVDCQVVLKAKQRGMDLDGILGVVRAQYLTKLSALRMRVSLSDQSWHSVTQLPCNRYQVSH